MARAREFVLLYCDNCGYEEEIHYKEIERRSLKCPQCGHYVDYEEVTLYDEPPIDESYYDMMDWEP